MHRENIVNWANYDFPAVIHRIHVGLPLTNEETSGIQTKHDMTKHRNNKPKHDTAHNAT